MIAGVGSLMETNANPTPKVGLVLTPPRGVANHARVSSCLCMGACAVRVSARVWFVYVRQHRTLELVPVIPMACPPELKVLAWERKILSRSHRTSDAISRNADRARAE